MPRYVRHDLSAPIKIEPQEKPVWVCACGLSKKFPFCDGTHKTACAAEPRDAIVVYGEDNRTIIETRPLPPRSAVNDPGPTPTA